MATYVLIPRSTSPLATDMSVSAGEKGPRGRSASLRTLLGRVRAAGTGGPLAVSDGSEESVDAEVIGTYAEPHSKSLSERRAPRTLEALGAVIVDDLDESQIEELIDDDIDVVENFQIPLEEPVDKSAGQSSEFWHLDKINAKAAWDQGFRGAGSRVGILDTGIDAGHPEFAGRTIAFMEFDAAGFKTSATPRDAGDHGTHVSGIAAGANCGVAPEADLSVAAVLTYPDERGRLFGYLAQILAGANWLLQSNFGAAGGPVDEVDVINASLGGRGYSDYLYSVLDLAQTVPATQLIASIGNSGPAQNSHGSPGNYDINLGIGATDVNDKIATFSSWGTVAAHAGLPKPDLSAPGVDVRSAQPGGGYQLMSGTSMSSPVVAGAAALLLQKHQQLRTRPATLRQIILSRTTPLSPAARIGRGRLDLSNF